VTADSDVFVGAAADDRVGPPKPVPYVAFSVACLVLTVLIIFVTLAMGPADADPPVPRHVTAATPGG
jgi:hypothetical protein